MLVHGTAAHARWWDHVGPLLPAGMRVVALDLSGHGDSDRREQYSFDRWAQEVVAVAADGGVSGPPVVIGHSLGGSIAIGAATRYGDALAGIVVIDSPLHEVPPEPQETVMGDGLRRRPDVSEPGGGPRPVPAHPRASGAALCPRARRRLLGSPAG